MRKIFGITLIAAALALHTAYYEYDLNREAGILRPVATHGFRWECHVFGVMSPILMAGCGAALLLGRPSTRSAS